VATLTVTQSGACQIPSGFVAIQPGTFQMGEVGVAEPVHSVTISYPFWMGAKEVTQAEYAALMGANPSYFQGNGNRPVEQVTWHNARSYCAALTAQQAALGAVPSGYEYRLPTEAEWEYACRAGTTTSWNVGNSLSCSQANHYSNGYCVGQTSVVGSYAPNAWGLYDMHGNVWEWCLDSYGGYPSGAVTDPFVTGGPNRVIRGGGWDSYSSDCRSAIRYNDGVPGDAYYSAVGFRVVLAPVLVP
jgi:formylglycine-generating enzyme required for sulfatase activity